ncbi:MAG TPA: cyclic peptide export ABC transporter [Telluria sp.]|nr:cyclic peptide export ABC transporter [Telluria sp.]
MPIFSYLFRESRLLLLLATAASLVTGFSGAGLATLISKGVVGSGAGQGGYAWQFFGLCLVFVLSRSLSEISLIHIVQNVILRLRVDLSRQVLATPLKKLQALGKSRVFAIMTNDISVFVEAFRALPMVLGNSALVASCLAYMAWLSWQLFLLFAALLGTCMVSYQLATRRALNGFGALRDKLDDLYKHFNNLIDGAKELQLNATRGVLFTEQVVAPDARSFRGLFIGAMSTYVGVTNIGLVLLYLLIGVFLFVVPAWGAMPGETLATFALILLFLVRPITDLMNAMPNLRQAGISLDKIKQLEEALGTPREAAPAGDPFRALGPLRLELRGVRHAYPSPTEDSQFMLGPLNLEIGQGEILYIVGGNGSGKTTLAMVLLGFYAPEEGELLLNGVPVTRDNLEAYRRYFSAVFSDFHLFEQLLSADEESVGLRAAYYVDKLKMAHKVKVVDGKFSTIDLSTGQRKRLALVSAYLEDRQVYLFDEWAADQDPAFKHVFYTELLPELKANGKTVVIITHDDAYFRYADRIVKLEDGHLKSAPHAVQIPEAAA